MNITHEQLSAYLDGALTPTERAEVDRALADSPKLRQDLADLKQLGSLLKSVPAPTPPPGFTHRVLEKTKPHPRAWLQWTFPLLGAATAALVMVYVARDSKMSFRSAVPERDTFDSKDLAIPNLTIAGKKSASEARKYADPQVQAKGPIRLAQPDLQTQTKNSKKELAFSFGNKSLSPATLPASPRVESGSPLPEESIQAGAEIRNYDAESRGRTKAIDSATTVAVPAAQPKTLASKASAIATGGHEEKLKYQDKGINSLRDSLVPQLKSDKKKSRRADAHELESSIKQEVASTSQEWQGDSSGILDPREIVIKDAASWTKLWKEHQSYRESPTSVPKINFKKFMVVGIFLGERGSSGFGVQLTEPKEIDNEIVIPYIETVPASGMMQLTVMSQPHHLKIIPRTNRPIRFKLL